MKQPLLKHVKPLIRYFSMAIIIQCISMDYLIAANKKGREKSLENSGKHFSMPSGKPNSTLTNAKGFGISISSNQADVTVTGTVTDQEGEPIPGVTVSIPGSSFGTATDLDGKYSITVPEDATLVFHLLDLKHKV